MNDWILLSWPVSGIAVLTINNPRYHNALNQAAMQQFAQTIQLLHNEPQLRVLVVTGAGQQSFCSGGDLIELRGKPSADDARDMITLMGDALLHMEELPVPVIAAINGNALGGGSEVALACDLRVVDSRVQMGFVQIRMAVTPGWGGGQRLARLVGPSRAMELLLGAAMLNMDSLKALGLANRIADEGQALPVAIEWAQQIAQRPPEVVRSIKSLFHAHRTQPYHTALQTERDLFPPLWSAPAHHQAVERYFERQPQ